MRLAMPEIERLGLPEDQLSLIREIDDALRSTMSQHAKRRVGFAKLSSENTDMIQRGLDEGLHHSDIAKLANTTRTTVWRHARRRHVIADD
jgi:IS30 family transposase